ncbi:MAG: hypothetical protein D6701_11265 [Gemmatimonadetes bacterium]|nr:MAG: hypothetical protein D6701_11265 [Gemmatimonadota bacterium]
MLALGTLLSLAAVPALAAQTIPSPYRFVETRKEASLLFGVASPDAGQFGLGPSSGQDVTARLGFDVGSALVLELASYYFLGDRDVQDPRRDEGDRAIGTADLDLLGFDGRLRLNLTGHRTWHRLQPSVFVGGGLAFTRNQDLSVDEAAQIPSENRFRFGTKFVASLGAGLAFHASETWVVRGDATLRLWKLNTPSGYQNPALGLGAVPRDEWVQAPTLSIGIGRRF